MKAMFVALIVIAAAMADQAAFAQQLSQDDIRWINACIRDNRGEGASQRVIRHYCFCMNERMDNNETRSISEWEKANPAAMQACERVSGWK
jgi:hypothetical protein